MRTYIFEGVVTALSSICHNGGERNGTVTQLRREKFIQPGGKVAAVPVVSGNSIRGILRDRGMFSMLRQVGYGVQADGKVQGLPLQAFYFLFSGGALASTGKEGIDVGHFRKLKSTIPLIGLFGGAVGNAIMPGKLKIGKLLPICKETDHLLPVRFRHENPQTIWEYCQTEMFTRRDDAKNDRLLPMLQQKQVAEQSGLFGTETAVEAEAPAKGAGPQQMMYNVETLAAGTQFYWKVLAEDVTDIEFEAFLACLIEFSKSPNIGGKGATGHGEIAVKLDNWVEIDSRLHLQGKEIDFTIGTKYTEHLKEKEAEIRSLLNSFA